MKHITQKRPLSWSQISSFEYSPGQWYDKYILGNKQPESSAMLFGKEIGNRLANEPSFMPQVPRLPLFEYILEGMLGDIPLIGFMDSYHPHDTLYEYKTGKPPWTQKRADEHGQIDMYLLIIYLSLGVRPEEIDCSLIWLPTQENSDFSISLVDRNDVKIFKTQRTMQDILHFGVRIHQRLKEMETYTQTRIA